MSILGFAPPSRSKPDVRMVDIGRLAPLLRQDGEGIWRADVAASVSYPDEGHSTCLGVEDTSFWFRHRNRVIVAAVIRAMPQGAGPFFDVGAGNGYVARGLADAGYTVVAIEPGLDGARNARRRGLEHVICATTHECRLLARSLPAIGVFDVVEHMPDDGAFLRHLQALLVPGGRLFVTVPAYDTLWSHDDVAAGHHRRYTRASVCAALRSAGFEIEYASHFFRVLPLPIFLLRSVPFRLGVRRRAASPAGVTRDHAARRPMLAALLERVLASELAHVAEGRPMTFGASILVIARAVV